MADRCGLGLQPWQAWAVASSLGERADGRWAAPEVAWVVPRQNGKSYAIAARVLAGLFIFQEELIVYTAHEFKTAYEIFRLVDGAARSTRATAQLMRPTRYSHGEETIELVTGQRFKIMARTKNSGRGFSADCVFFDEALELRDHTAVAALIPTMSARPNPQRYYVSSAGDPGSLVLASVRDRALRGAGRLCYLEWSARPDVDLEDEADWLPEALAANPAAPDMITVETILDEREALPAARFAQERLGIWPGQVRGRLFPAQPWADTQRTDVPDPEAGSMRVVFEVVPDRSAAAVTIAWLAPDGRPHIRVARWAPGDGWLLEHLAALADAWQVGIGYDDTGPARDIAAALAAAGVPLVKHSLKDLTAASAGLLSGLMNGTVTHHPDAALDAAAEHAQARRVGEAWAISRRTPTPAAPLIAGALAVLELVTTPDPAPFKIW